MARVYLLDHPQQKIMYVVSQAVGSGCSNQRDDVLLVQFFLRVAMESEGGKPGLSVPGEAPISIDGLCGQKTVKYIKSFQAWDSERNPGSVLNLDGKVDAPQGSGFGARTGKFLTISSLNVHYRNRRPNLMFEIYKDPLFPSGLRASLMLG